jgi:hypothetical protein
MREAPPAKLSGVKIQTWGTPTRVVRLWGDGALANQGNLKLAFRHAFDIPAWQYSR